MFTWVEISEEAIRFNIRQFKKFVGEKNIMPVVKANAYGHDIELVSKICDTDKNVSKICVVNSEEAEKLLAFKIKKPILILSFYTEEKNKLKKLIQQGVEFPVYRLDQIKLLNEAAKTTNKKVKVHIKIDTGTSRVGFLLEDLPNVTKELKKAKNITVEGIFSHFASSEEDFSYTIKQNNIFQKAVKLLESGGVYSKLKHMACTSAALGFKFDNLNAIRLGLGLYGLYPDKKSQTKVVLKPALTWKTKIIQIKILPKNTKIGYGGSFVAKKTIKLAVLPVGYCDGYTRSLSNISKVVIDNHLCPVRGRICMNLMMVEIPIKANIKPGDTAILLGKHNKTEINADQLATWSDTINYEVTTRINPSIKRLKI